MNKETGTPLDSRKPETPSISIGMSDLQLASSSKNDNKTIPATPKTGDTKSPTTTTTTTTPQSTDSSNDNPKAQLQRLFPSDDNRAVYHVLKTIGFKGPWIRFLMQDQCLDTYQQLTSLKLDDWTSYMKEQPTDEYKPLFDQRDFDRIVIFQNWCQLNSHYEDASLAFKYSRDDYVKSWDEQFQLSASPTDPDLPPKKPSSTPTHTPTALGDSMFKW